MRRAAEGVAVGIPAHIVVDECGYYDKDGAPTAYTVQVFGEMRHVGPDEPIIEIKYGNPRRHYDPDDSMPYLFTITPNQVRMAVVDGASLQGEEIEPGFKSKPPKRTE